MAQTKKGKQSIESVLKTSSSLFKMLNSEKLDKKKMETNFPIINRIINKEEENEQMDTVVSEIVSEIKKKQVIKNSRSSMELIELAFNKNKDKDKPENNNSKRQVETFDKIMKAMGGVDIFKKDIKGREDTYNANRFINMNIPKLGTAINVLAENIISPDEINKKSIQITPFTAFTYADRNSDIGKKIYQERIAIRAIIEKYNLEKNLLSIVSNTLINGDYFIEFYNIQSNINTFLTETKDFVDYKTYDSNMNKNFKDNKGNIIKLIESEFIEYDKSNSTNNEGTLFKNLIENEIFEIIDRDNDEDFLSLEEYTYNQLKESRDTKNTNFEFEDFSRNILDAIDNPDIKFLVEQRLSDYKEQKYVNAFINSQNSNSNFNNNKEKKEEEETNPDKIENDISSMIMKIHEPENVIKLEIEGVNLGYIIIKPKEIKESTKNNIYGNYGNKDINKGSNSSAVDKFASILYKNLKEKNKKQYLKQNKEFNTIINALIEKQKGATIRFVEAKNMVHWKNQNTNGKNIYGESVFSKLHFMAKHYLALLISYSVFLITRAPERRKITVEVGNDNDAAGSIQNIIKTIKSKEYSMNSLGNIDTLPDTLTAFDDIFIPVINGQSPVNIESVPGQQNSVDTEYLKLLQDNLISGVNVPPSLLGETDNSYHTTLSQENQKFARTIIRYQQQYSICLFDTINAAYRMLHGTEIEYHEITFLQPMFIKVEQTANMIGQLDTISNFVVDCFGYDENQKPKLNKLDIAKTIASIINWDEYERLYDKSLTKNKITELLNKTKATDPNAPAGVGATDPNAQANSFDTTMNGV